MNARDIMTKEVITILKETPLKEVAHLMVEHRISGLPVVEEGRLLGMITESDLLIRAKKLDLPTFFPFIGGVIYLEGPGKLEQELKKATATKAEEIMTTKLHTVKPDTSLTDISTLMAEKGINRLPVVEDGKLAGIITRNDVIRAIAAQME